MQSSELQSKFTLVISLSATFDYKLHQFSPQSHTLPKVKNTDGEDLSSFVLNIHMQTHFERVGRP